VNGCRSSKGLCLRYASSGFDERLSARDNSSDLRHMGKGIEHSGIAFELRHYITNLCVFGARQLGDEVLEEMRNELLGPGKQPWVETQHDDFRRVLQGVLDHVQQGRFPTPPRPDNPDDETLFCWRRDHMGSDRGGEVCPT